MMRFILGLALGVGAGFAASVLLAPDKQKSTAAPGGGSLGRPAASQGANGSASFKSIIESVRKQLDDAMTEAKKAQKEAEAEMTQRYKKLVPTSRK